MTVRIATTFRSRAMQYLELAAETRKAAAGTKRARWRYIDARHFIMEARELSAAAAHSGWRLP